jgi:hypothetical protein
VAARHQGLRPSPPVGPAGIRTCTGEEPPGWRAGAGVAHTWTKINFDLGQTTAIKDAVSAVLERRLGERTGIQIGVGAALSGVLRNNNESYDLLPGPLASVAFSYRLVDGHAAVPFVLASIALGASTNATRPRLLPNPATAHLVGTDARVGVAAGWTLGPVSPYLAARAFGLPATWRVNGERTTGGDAYHYQLGGGLVVRVDAVDLTLEAAPIGEGVVSAGAGVAF